MTIHWDNAYTERGSAHMGHELNEYPPDIDSAAEHDDGCECSSCVEADPSNFVDCDGCGLETHRGHGSFGGELFFCHVCGVDDPGTDYDPTWCRERAAAIAAKEKRSAELLGVCRDVLKVSP